MLLFQFEKRTGQPSLASSLFDFKQQQQKKHLVFSFWYLASGRSNEKNTSLKQHAFSKLFLHVSKSQ